MVIVCTFRHGFFPPHVPMGGQISFLPRQGCTMVPNNMRYQMACVFRTRMFVGGDCIFFCRSGVIRNSLITIPRFRSPAARLFGLRRYECGILVSLVGICEALFHPRLLSAILLGVRLLCWIGWCFRLVRILLCLSLVLLLVLCFLLFQS